MPDPYLTLGVRRSASDAEVRSAYRRLVQLHHPDHNDGSVESARRFEEVQKAYAEVRRLRQPGAAGSRTAGSRRPGTAGSRPPGTPGSRPPGTPGSPPPGSSAPPDDDSDIGSRLAAMEAELRDARDRAVREARRAAQRAQSQRDRERPSDEELGYVDTDDSFSKILSDAAGGLGDRLGEVEKGARESRVTKRFADLIDELGSRLTGEPPDGKSS